jgi:hypothetical protein
MQHSKCGRPGSKWGNRAMNAEEYRREAERYLRSAHQMTDPNARALLIDVAARWMLLAEQAEQNQRLDHAERNH